MNNKEQAKDFLVKRDPSLRDLPLKAIMQELKRRGLEIKIEDKKNGSS